MGLRRLLRIYAIGSKISGAGSNEPGHEKMVLPHLCKFIWSSTRENLHSGFPTNPCLNRHAQLQSLAGILKFCLENV